MSEAGDVAGMIEEAFARLEYDGLIERTGALRDGRPVYVETEAGREWDDRISGWQTDLEHEGVPAPEARAETYEYASWLWRSQLTRYRDALRALRGKDRRRR